MRQSKITTARPRIGVNLLGQMPGEITGTGQYSDSLLEALIGRNAVDLILFCPEGRSRFDDRLGIELMEITSDRLAREGLPRRYAGLQIQRIDPDGPAHNYLLPEEIITHVEGERVRTEEDLHAALESVRPGQIISVQTARLLPQAVQTRSVRFRIGSN